MTTTARRYRIAGVLAALILAGIGFALALTPGAANASDKPGGTCSTVGAVMHHRNQYGQDVTYRCEQRTSVGDTCPHWHFVPTAGVTHGHAPKPEPCSVCVSPPPVPTPVPPSQPTPAPTQPTSPPTTAPTSPATDPTHAPTHSPTHGTPQARQDRQPVAHSTPAQPTHATATPVAAVAVACAPAPAPVPAVTLAAKRDAGTPWWAVVVAIVAVLAGAAGMSLYHRRTNR